MGPGTILGNYEIESLIGQGGMAEVWLARHRVLGNPCAIKVLTIGSPAVKKRLLLEGQVQASLRHTNIVAVNDVVDLEGGLGLVMEYVDGAPLDQWLERRRPSIDDALVMFCGIVLGVAAAHAAGVVHRDLKPANILIANSATGPVPKVADFGIVKVLDQRGSGTGTGVTMGTAEYMPPEQILDASTADQRSDIWALGCILYELVTGQTCFSGASQIEIFNRVLNVDWVPPSQAGVEVPPRVEQTLRAIFQREPSERIQSCRALLDRLYERPPIAMSLPPVSIAATFSPAQRAAAMPRTPTEPAPATAEVRPEPPPRRTPPEGPATTPTLTTSEEAQLAQEAERRLALERPRRRVAILLPFALGLLLVAAVVGAVGGVLAVVAIGPNRVAEGTPPPVSVTVPVVAPAPVAAVPAPPTDPAPAVVQPRRAPPRKAPRPSEPEPTTAVAPDPAPAPAPPPEPTLVPGQVAVDGDATQVWVVGNAGRLPVPGDVPPGDYAIDANFGTTQLERIGRVTVRSGETVRLECSSFVYTCRAK